MTSDYENRGSISVKCITWNLKPGMISYKLVFHFLSIDNAAIFCFRKNSVLGGKADNYNKYPVDINQEAES